MTQLAYLAAVALCVAVAVWLQATVELRRSYRLLSWGTALVFAAGLLPQVLAAPGLESVAQLVLFATAPLIVIPFQVRMIRLITGDPTEGSTGPRGQVRGPGGGRVRARDRRKR